MTEDLHSPLKGFWWSHVGWIVCRKYQGTDFDTIKDFAKYPELRWLDKYYMLPPALLGVACFALGGWSALVGLPAVTDTSIAIIAAISLFIVPDGRGGRLLDWEGANRIPWGILILLGTGFTIARAFSESGLAHFLGAGPSGLSGLPVLVMIGGVCLVVTFMTELTSNTATTTLLMPILAAAALAAGFDDPALMMLPAALTASCAFMLPTATTPNGVAFSTGRFPLRKMVSEGITLNLLGVIVVTFVSYWMLR